MCDHVMPLRRDWGLFCQGTRLRDGVACEQVACEQMACDQVPCEQVTGEQVAGDQVPCDLVVEAKVR